MSGSDRSWSIAPALLWFIGVVVAALLVLDGVPARSPIASTRGAGAGGCRRPDVHAAASWPRP
jgi:hypothetical protein